MRPDHRKHQSEEDRVDALWDRINGTPDEQSSVLSPTAANTIDYAAIGLLASMVPPVVEESLARIRQKFEAGIEKEAIMSTTLRGEQAVGKLPTRETASSPTPNRIRRIPRTLNWIAAAVLIMAVVGSAFVAGPGRSFLPEQVEHQLAALPGFETDERSQQPAQGDRSLMSIRIQPGAAPSGQIVVGLWRVTMAPGSSLEVPANIQLLGQDPVAQFVESGSVIVAGQGEEFSATAEQNFGVQALESYRNDSSHPVDMLLLAPVVENGAFPLLASSASDASPAPASALATTLLGANTILANDGYQVRVTVSTLHYADMLDQHVFRGATPAYVVIDQGEITVSQAETDGTPASVKIYATGDIIQLGGNNRLNATYTETGLTPLSALIVETAPMSDNPTLDQSTKAAAPFWTEWTVPADGHISLALRKITIQPGGFYSLPTDAGIAYSVVSGTIDLTLDGGESTTLQPGSVVGQNPGTILSFNATANEPAVLMQSVVTASDEGAFATETAHNATITTMVQAAGQLPAGPASIMLEQHSYTGGNGSRSSSEGSPSITLATAAQGTISLGRVGGEVSIVTSPGSGEAEAPLGTSIAIGEGGYLLAQPGSGWSMSGYGTEQSVGVALTISPVDPGASTPQAISSTPIASEQTIVLKGNAMNCTIAPLTVVDIDRVMATPAVETSPLERSQKSQPGGQSDEATTRAITNLLQQYVDCSASGNYQQTYALFSDQAIRENDALRDLVERDWQVGEHPTRASVEDIVLFDDGRAGARTVIDGEPAYLTFIKQNGEWKIDVWDDSQSTPQTVATPQT